jgi:hypothetical protein
MKTHVWGIVVLIAFLTVSMISCDIPSDPLNESGKIASKPGIIEIYLTDFPLEGKEVKEVWINILQVEIHSESVGWQTVVDNNPDGVRYDLLELVDNAALVGVKELQPDLYTQIRLILGESNEVCIDTGNDEGEYLPLTVPSGEQTGIKLTGNFELISGGKVKILLDFDARKSIHVTGEGDYVLKPTIEIKEVTKIESSGKTYARIYIETFHPDGILNSPTDMKISLYDSKGITLAETPLFEGVVAFLDYTEGLESGIYCIKISGGGELHTGGHYAISVLELGLSEKPPSTTEPGSLSDDPYETDGGISPWDGFDAVDITVGDTLVRNLSTGEDIDWFELRLP